MDANLVDRDFDSVARDIDPVARDFDPVVRGFDPVPRDFCTVSRDFDPVTRDFNPVSMDANLVDRDFDSVARDFDHVARDADPVVSTAAVARDAPEDSGPSPAVASGDTIGRQVQIVWRVPTWRQIAEIGASGLQRVRAVTKGKHSCQHSETREAGPRGSGRRGGGGGENANQPGPPSGDTR